jgi:hypothetical protein
MATQHFCRSLPALCIAAFAASLPLAAAGPESSPLPPVPFVVLPPSVAEPELPVPAVPLASAPSSLEPVPPAAVPALGGLADRLPLLPPALLPPSVPLPSHEPAGGAFATIGPLHAHESFWLTHRSTASKKRPYASTQSLQPQRIQYVAMFPRQDAEAGKQSAAALLASKSAK